MSNNFHFFVVTNSQRIEALENHFKTKNISSVLSNFLHYSYQKLVSKNPTHAPAPNGDIEDADGYMAPVEHTSKDEGKLPPAPAPFSNSDDWNRKSEKDSLKSQNKEQAFKISKLSQTIEELKAEKAENTEKLTRKENEISKKDSLIARLEEDCKEKDHYIGVLKTDKANLERAIEKLRKKSQEDISKLQEKLKEVESKEEDAQNALAKVQDMLAMEKEQVACKEREIKEVIKEKQDVLDVFRQALDKVESSAGMYSYSSLTLYSVQCIEQAIRIECPF